MLLFPLSVRSGAVTFEHASTFLNPPLAGRTACREGNKGVHNQRCPSEEGSRVPTP